MVTETGLYEGRKGQKRLKAIEKQIEKIESEFENDYSDSPEMLFLSQEIRWEGTGRLIFIIALKNVNFAWSGLRDYGFIRLCCQWVKEHRVDTLSSGNTSSMLRSILPDEICDAIGGELSELEIS